MSTVLLAEEAVREMALEEASQIPVTVTLLLTENNVITFQQEENVNYTVTGKTVSLVGSGGSPREFILTFVLSQPIRDLGWTFFNPALKFFQGNGKNAGFRFAPNSSGTSVQLSLFNTMNDKDSQANDPFSILLLTKDGVIVHDPTIVWDIPGGG